MPKKDPNKTFVNLNYMCNNNCISCIREEQGRFAPEPSIKDIYRQIDQILDWSDHIEFNGGEPTLRKDLTKILDYAVAKKPTAEITLLSNVRFFSNELMIRSLPKSNKFKIVTSIYGHDSKTHDSITRTPGSFKQQINGINNLIKRRISVELRVIITKLNCKTLPKISSFIIGNYLPRDLLRIAIVNMKISGIAEDNCKAISYKISDIIPLLTESFNKLKSAGFEVKLFHFPHCILPRELWPYSIGKSAELDQISFPKQCSKCLSKDQCTGVWNGYLKLYGPSEFKPILSTDDQSAILSYLLSLEDEEGVSAEIVLESAKALFNELGITKMRVSGLLFSFYPVLKNEWGYCGTCLCEGGYPYLNGKVLEDFDIDLKLNITKGNRKIPLKMNKKLISIYVCAINSAVQKNKEILKRHLSNEEEIFSQGKIISQIGFARLGYVNYPSAKKIYFFDRGLFMYQERKKEAEKELSEMRSLLKKSFATKVVFSGNISKQILSETDILLATGSTISNGSIEFILENTKKSAEKVIWGRSCLLYPDILFKKGVTLISSSIPPRDLLEYAKKDILKYNSLGEPGEHIVLAK
jgi:hypothetical protein